MKKLLVISMTLLIFSGISCSKNDDNNKTGDPIFEAEFKPLSRVQDLTGNVWVYAGNKIGDRPVGLISQYSCISRNSLVFTAVNTTVNGGVFEFLNYGGANGLCEVEYITKLMVHYVRDNEAWCTFGTFLPGEVPPELGPAIPPIDIDPEGEGENEGKRISTANVENSLPLSGSNLQKVEIGYQAGYLRVEDKLTKYNGNEKVYLYFREM